MRRIQAEGELPMFPFGSDFTPQELKLAKLLKALAAKKPAQLLPLLLKGLSANAALHTDDLQRLQLQKPQGIKHKIEQLLVLGALSN